MNCALGGRVWGGGAQEGPLDDWPSGQEGPRTMVCSDVGSRGLDVPDMTHVLHFNVAPNWEVYCHRAGRAGRYGREVRAALRVGPPRAAPRRRPCGCARATGGGAAGWSRGHHGIVT
jgi:hypothetical protein